MFFTKQDPNTIHYYDTQDPKAKQKFSGILISHFKKAFAAQRPLVFLCIGSDRATGDALGPLIGQNIQQFKNKKRVLTHTLFVYGSLSKPVHAMNLSETVNLIYQNHAYPYIIAIDASLGIQKHIGYVTLGHGPLTPGIGVGKRLPAVGDAHITGIVNTGNGADLNQILQTTHLSTVVELSDFVSDSIVNILQQC
ncbi:MAG: spore protease YyaC [Eubacteriales bacterium]|nr:spore protease YyaC [Eubacteriales bacterium]